MQVRDARSPHKPRDPGSSPAPKALTPPRSRTTPNSTVYLRRRAQFAGCKLLKRCRLTGTPGARGACMQTGHTLPAEEGDREADSTDSRQRQRQICNARIAARRLAGAQARDAAPHQYSLVRCQICALLAASDATPIAYASSQNAASASMGTCPAQHASTHAHYHGKAQRMPEARGRRCLA